MRVFLALAILLAGCAAAPEPSPEPAVEPVLQTTESVVRLAESAVVWHDNGSPLDTYAQAAQAVAHPCLWDDAREIYFTNQQLGMMGGIPENTTHLLVTFDWDDGSYMRDALRIGFKGQDTERYRETQPFARGDAMEVPVSPADWGPDDAWARAIDLWACVEDDGNLADVPPAVFYGELRYTVDAVVIVQTAVPNQDATDATDAATA